MIVKDTIMYFYGYMKELIIGFVGYLSELKKGLMGIIHTYSCNVCKYTDDCTDKPTSEDKTKK